MEENHFFMNAILTSLFLSLATIVDTDANDTCKLFCEFVYMAFIFVFACDLFCASSLNACIPNPL